jgi:hypothetical protein
VSLAFTAVSVVLGLLATSACSHRIGDPLRQFPQVMLWSWDHSEDLRFIDPRSTGVAFLAQTIHIEPGGAISSPRLSQLRYPEGTALMAVVRLESSGKGLPPSSEVVREILPTARLQGIRAVQLDFDARRSERRWYAAVLRGLRTALAPSIPLTITALVSWCERDDWIRRLPIADACPMLFRMGDQVHESIGEFEVPLCDASIGVSMDELPGKAPRGRRIFFFYPGKWTPAAYESAIAQARRWR